MKEEELATLVRAQLIAGLARYGVTGIPVLQGYSTVNEGRMDAAIYFWPLPDAPEGWQYRRHVTDPETLLMTTEETQVIASTFQVSPFIPLDPGSPPTHTAKDIATLCRMVVQSQPFIRAMTRSKVGVRLPTLIRNPKFVNDRDQYEDNPSFDFTVTHKQVIIQDTDSITRIEVDIRRV